MLLSNYLAVLTKPNYNKPIKNIDDFLASDKGLFYIYAEYLKQLFANTPDSQFQQLAERLIAPDDKEHYQDLLKRVHSDNDVVSLNAWLQEDEYGYGSWYRSDPLT